MILEGDAPEGHGFLVGSWVDLVGAHHTSGDALDVAGADRARRPERVLDQPGLGFNVEAGEGDVQIGAEAAQLVHRHLEGGRRRLAQRGRDRHSIGRYLLESGGVEPGCHVWSQVGRRANLIEQLRGNGANGYCSTGTVVLADDRRAVGRDLGPREPGVGEPVELGEKRIVAAGGLGTAFDDVPGHHRTGQGIPVVSGPAVVPRRRAAHHRGIGDPTGHHDVSTCIQRLDNAEGSEVGVGRDEARRVPHRLARLEMIERYPGLDQLPEPGKEIVAVHVSDRGRQPEAFRDLGHRCGAPVRVEPSCVGHHLDAPVQTGTHDLLHLGDERARVAAVRALQAGASEDQHGELGQPVAGEYIDRSTLDHLRGRGQAVAVEAGTVGDADRFGHDSTSACGSNTSSTAPLVTCWPATTRTSATTPSAGAAMWCSIFMASSTISVSPAATI